MTLAHYYDFQVVLLLFHRENVLNTVTFSRSIEIKRIQVVTTTVLQILLLSSHDANPTKPLDKMISEISFLPESLVFKKHNYYLCLLVLINTPYSRTPPINERKVKI